MELHFQLNDQEFETQFRNCELSPDLFTHEAHIRLAWIHLKNYGIDQAVQNVCAQLRRYTAHLGAADKYHETLTVAAVRTVYHFILKAESIDFEHFIHQYPRLKRHFKELLAQHYSTDIFRSETARSTYLEPELLPFD